jgi:hypothetical protein
VTAPVVRPDLPHSGLAHQPVPHPAQPGRVERPADLVAHHVVIVAVGLGLIELGDAQVLTVQVAAAIERDRTVAARGLGRVVRLGFLENLETKRGRAGRYVVGTQTMPEDTPAIPHSIPPEACTPAQVAPESPQVSDWCAAVQLCNGDEGSSVCVTETDIAAQSPDLTDAEIEAVLAAVEDEEGGDDFALVAEDPDEGSWSA